MLLNLTAGPLDLDQGSDRSQSHEKSSDSWTSHEFKMNEVDA